MIIFFIFFAKNNTAMNYKILIVGDGGVGKSTLVNKIKTNIFEKEYIPTMGLDVYSLKINTNHGRIMFKLWDCAGQEKFRGLRDAYYINSDAAILVYDTGFRLSHKNLLYWNRDIDRVNDNIPKIVFENKIDLPSEPIDDEKLPYNYYKTTSREEYDFNIPFLDLAKMLTGYEDLFFL